jgi:hypothetical protein
VEITTGELNMTTTEMVEGTTTELINENVTTTMFDENMTNTVVDGNMTTTVVDGNMTTTVVDGNMTTTVVDGNMTTTVMDGNMTTTVVEETMTTTSMVDDTTSALNDTIVGQDTTTFVQETTGQDEVTTTSGGGRRLAEYCECDAAMCKTYQCPLGMTQNTARMNATQGQYGRDCCQVDPSASYFEVSGTIAFKNVDATEAQVDEAVREALAIVTSATARNVWTNISAVAGQPGQDWSVGYTVRTQDQSAADSATAYLQGLTESQASALLTSELSIEGVAVGDLGLVLQAPGEEGSTDTTTVQASEDNTTTTVTNTTQVPDTSEAAELSIRVAAVVGAAALVRTFM